MFQNRKVSKQGLVGTIYVNCFCTLYTHLLIVYILFQILGRHIKVDPHNVMQIGLAKICKIVANMFAELDMFNNSIANCTLKSPGNSRGRHSSIAEPGPD